jgi:hypothetical protein
LTADARLTRLFDRQAIRLTVDFSDGSTVTVEADECSRLDGGRSVASELIRRLGDAVRDGTAKGKQRWAAIEKPVVRAFEAMCS